MNLTALTGAGLFCFNELSSNARAFFTGREYTRGQFSEAVAAAGFNGSKLVLVHQVHGDHVLCVKPESLPSTDAEADGLVTDARGIALGIKTADCLPVFFSDTRTGVIGAVHAGWRGLKAGILEQALSKMVSVYGCKPEGIRVAIGPAIRACCYEVGPEFASYFPEFYTEGRPKEPHAGAGGVFDAVGEARARLLRQGVTPEFIQDSGFCTACRTDLFYSFRAEKSAERILSFIVRV